jgi:hypothetical protein
LGRPVRNVHSLYIHYEQIYFKLRTSETGH